MASGALARRERAVGEEGEVQRVTARRKRERAVRVGLLFLSTIHIQIHTHLK
jgi:hypothetical protein